MPSPFPGMDPYLEDPDVWPDVHASLITTFRELLTPRVGPRYVARVEQRTFLYDPDDPAQEVYLIPDARIVKSTRPSPTEQRTSASSVALAIAPSIDVTGKVERWAVERFIEIRDAASREVVTIIEVVSPSNKIKGSEGRRKFVEKRDEVRGSSTSWLEVDLLRAGASTVGIPTHPSAPYRAYVDRTLVEGREQRIWAIALRTNLPVIGVPLRPGEPDVPLDLQEALNLVYSRADYALDTDYTKPPRPPLAGDDVAWAAELVRERIR